MKMTIKKVKNYDFGGGLVKDVYFVKVWDKYGDLVESDYAGDTREEAEQTKSNMKNNSYYLRFA
jgi:hypothetical protein